MRPSDAEFERGFEKLISWRPPSQSFFLKLGSTQENKTPSFVLSRTVGGGAGCAAGAGHEPAIVHDRRLLLGGRAAPGARAAELPFAVARLAERALLRLPPGAPAPVQRLRERAAGAAAVSPVQDRHSRGALHRQARAGHLRAAGARSRRRHLHAARPLFARRQRAVQVPGARAQDGVRAAASRGPLPPAAAAPVPHQRAQPVQPARRPRHPGGGHRRRGGRRARARPVARRVPRLDGGAAAGDRRGRAAGRAGHRRRRDEHAAGPLCRQGRGRRRRGLRGGQAAQGSHRGAARSGRPAVRARAEEDRRGGARGLRRGQADQGRAAGPPLFRGRSAPAAAAAAPANTPG
eukprot:scaffold5082_cov106-Isochrysis_galbana.AAC.3